MGVCIQQVHSKDRINGFSSTLTFTPRLCVIPEVLSPEEAEETLVWALSDMADFKTATTVGGAPDARRAQTRDTLAPRPLESALAHFLPVVETILGVQAREKRVECQATVHQDGDYFRRHLDVGEGSTATRLISFIYYLHRSPRPFTGGQLRVYDTLATPEAVHAAASFRDIEPVHNSIVFFPSAGVFHEVLPVTCPSRRAEDGRISCNGWIH
ncbi:2OG-Fe(II) oxygenase [Streptomyces sp. NPDC057686]|uniref:2OG-Fe(II) oxygenase n=1 Tax=Streptomyces sp. NPDC057686 TaxID=3346212 RepID=UPI0036C21643